MDKNKIYETAFETIKESTEWGISCKDETYGHWVDGVVTMAENLIDEIDKKNNNGSVED